MNYSSFLVVLLLVALAAVCEADVNPCHSNKVEQGKGVTCGKIVLPRGLCRACKLKPFIQNGNFQNCKSIYDLDDEFCQRQLKFYAQLNKDCDPVRANQVKDFSINANREGLDYFVYSVCEECCDCIPRGAKIGQYDSRLATNTLFKVDRGNCPAHAWYDICKIWPKVTYLSLPGWKDPKSEPPQICPLLTDWLNSPASNNWLGSSTVEISDRIRKFLTRFINVAKCKKRNVWTTCHGLEQAQNRI